MKILIGADLVPTDSNTILFQKGDALTLLGEELCTIIQSADYRIFNLETPLTNNAAPIDKNGPALMAVMQTIAGYDAMGVNLLTLANNHIMDHGVQGLDSTLKTLDMANIAHIGAGDTLAEAQKPFVFELSEKKIGVYACAEHEFSIAGVSKPGANPFDPLESLDHVAELKAQCDYVIVLYHAGKEHYRYPSPGLQKICRKMVEKGADLVVCQHSHCIGCEEKYRDGTIVYGQGNFLFDSSESEYWQTGLLIEIGDDFTISYLPLSKTGNGIRLASGEKATKILADFTKRSEEITDCAFIEKQYKDFATSMRDGYLVTLGGGETLLFRVVNKLLGNWPRKCKIARRYNKKTRLAVQNIIECEAHRELVLQGLRNEQ